jgi:hypothetical protein
MPILNLLGVNFNGKHRRPFGTRGDSSTQKPDPGNAGTSRPSNPLAHTGNPDAPFPEWPKPREAGVRAGEIIGWRCWREVSIIGAPPYLFSTAMPHRWDRTMKAHDDPIKEIPNPTGIGRIGLFAWKERDFAMHHAELMQRGKVHAILGSVELWGSVVIHEFGYRAEYARVRSIDAWYPGTGEIGTSEHVVLKHCNLLTQLRKMYGVYGGPENDHRGPKDSS